MLHIDLNDVVIKICKDFWSLGHSEYAILNWTRLLGYFVPEEKSPVSSDFSAASDSSWKSNCEFYNLCIDSNKNLLNSLLVIYWAMWS